MSFNFHVLEELMLEAGDIKGRDLRLEVRRIRSGASRDRPRDVVWLDFMAPHHHLVIDVTLQVLAQTPMFLVYMLVSNSLTALHWEVNMANLMRTSTLLLCLARLRFSRSMTTINPFAMEDGGRYDGISK
jgi:hypothetical protein